MRPPTQLTLKRSRAKRLRLNKRCLIVTASRYALPIIVIGRFDNGRRGSYILCKTTR